jgi:hypothetical protein
MRKNLMHSFDRLPPAERAQEYLERAGVYQEFSRTAATEGAKRLFHQLALDMIARANSATVPATNQTDEARE